LGTREKYDQIFQGHSGERFRLRIRSSRMT
jgi:hypothetical protein